MSLETTTDYLVSRHPIFKPGIQVAGYEVRSNATGTKEAELDAYRSVFSMLGEVGWDQVAGPHSCFVNLTREALAGEVWHGVPTNRVVLGYFDEFQPSDDIVNKLIKAANTGFHYAVSAHLSPESMYVVGNRAHALKVDVTRVPADELKGFIKDLRKWKAKILADQIDTYDDLELCKPLQFDLYEGRFISRSAAKEDRQIPVNRVAMMRVLAQLQDPELSMADLEKSIALDAALSYKLLTYVNSAAVGLPQTVSSVGHAMRLVGLQRLRAWTSILLLSSVDDKPRELMTISLIRARMCEQLAEAVKAPQKESYFSAGLLSVVDALLDCSMEKALAGLPLTEDVRSALIRHSGRVGEALSCALAYEQAEWDKVQFSGLPQASIREIYMNALKWATPLASGLAS
jgi:EAL and modified HD-GYP domain-containing signal transduction protein